MFVFNSKTPLLHLHFYLRFLSIAVSKENLTHRPIIFMHLEICIF